MKIYDMPGLPNPLRVRVALAEKGLTDRVAFENVDIMKGEHQTAEFRAKNPSAASSLAIPPLIAIRRWGNAAFIRTTRS